MCSESAKLSAQQIGKSKIRVSLKNVGEKPIRVDKKLVFLLQLKARVSDGSPILLCRRGTSSLKLAERLENRIVALSPGKTIERDIDLLRFEVFETGISSPGNRVSAYEAIRGVPNMDDVSTVTLVYDSGIWSLLRVSRRISFLYRNERSGDEDV